MRRRRLSLRACFRYSCPQSHLEGIGGVEQQRGFGIHESGTADKWNDAAVDNAHTSFKDAAHDTLLPPNLAFA